MAEYGSESVIFFEVIQPICSRRYGDAFGSPTGGCQAQLGVTGDRKCFNTRVTCQDPTNYNPESLTLRFARDQVGLLEYGVGEIGSPLEDISNIIPSLISISTNPAAINLGAMDRSASALGQREVVTVDLFDHKHSDLHVDPYRLERITGDAGPAEYLLMKGMVGDFVSTPDPGSPGGITTTFNDLDVRVHIALDDWTPTPIRTDIIAKRDTGGLIGQFMLSVTGGSNTPRGRLTLFWWDSGGTLKIANSTQIVNATDGEAIHIRATIDLETSESPSNYVVTFYKSQDGENWTQIGDAVTTAGSTSIAIRDDPWRINPDFDGSNNVISGKIYSVHVYSGIDGTLLIDFDPSLSALGDTTITSSTGDVWTINQAGNPFAELASDGYDPYESGTFWGKWLARNPYHSNYACRVREGYIGQTLDEMRVRNYIIDRVDGPVNGRVKITAKDLFSKIEAKKAVAPTASRGELLADISAVATSATLSPTGIGDLDYPAIVGSPSEFYVAIGEEVIKCSRSGDTLNLLTRGALDTVAAAHDQEDLVQWVLVYDSQLCHDIVQDLLVNYSEISASLIDSADWDTQAEQLTQLYTARIADPTPVNELIGELAEQAGFTVWPDPVTQMIQFRALRAAVPTPTINDDDWILEDSFSSKLQISKRVSEVWVYYGQKSPVEDLEERRNFRSRLVVVDTDAEDSTQYGVPAIREVFSRWIPQFGRSFAEDTADRILAQFRDPPIEAEFRLYADRDGALELTQQFYLEVAELQDEIGELEPTPMAVTQLARGENDIRVKAQEVHFTVQEGEESVERIIYIENDDYNLNLRTIHDSLYAPPLGGSPSEQITFIIISGVTVGSTSTSSPALRTGSWPANVLLTLENRGRIQGKGGKGGDGYPFTTDDGGAGGDALLVESLLRLENAAGEIWGGGGGGAGNQFVVCSGGGAAGTDPGLSGTNEASQPEAADGTTESGGAVIAVCVGLSGAGGNPGLAGGTGSGSGTGGAAGKYINGIANVIMGSPQGDLRGGVS